MSAILVIQISIGDSSLKYTGKNWQINKSFIMYAVAVYLNKGRNIFNCSETVKVTAYWYLIIPNVSYVSVFWDPIHITHKQDKTITKERSKFDWSNYEGTLGTVINLI